MLYWIAAMQQLHCRKCGRALTAPVEFVAVADAHPDGVKWRDEASPTPRGRALVSHEPFGRSLQGPPNPLEFTPQVWMHLDDLLEVVGWTKDVVRLSGCCGPSGSDGPNRTCECRRHVGTSMHDCWTPAMFVPDPETTEWREVETS